MGIYNMKNSQVLVHLKRTCLRLEEEALKFLGPKWMKLCIKPTFSIEKLMKYTRMKL